MLEANLALVSVRQNDVIKEISSWAAIIAVPTFIASVYGMNFDHMPELQLEDRLSAFAADDGGGGVLPLSLLQARRLAA